MPNDNWSHTIFFFLKEFFSISFFFLLRSVIPLIINTISNFKLINTVFLGMTKSESERSRSGFQWQSRRNGVFYLLERYVFAKHSLWSYIAFQIKIIKLCNLSKLLVDSKGNEKFCWEYFKKLNFEYLGFNSFINCYFLRLSVSCSIEMK